MHKQEALEKALAKAMFAQEDVHIKVDTLN